ncbi:Tetratricopeptide repeat-containing protein [Reichenbachiella faecimaris]|uniref:Tetratricopeptide repeat-containing protein n=1 Tax=Reichenbachiella faecimaris TaxID=692418 RepID=A0A1W2GI97_REIFA|nr:tetratricopeptide repeat protein [Reichenbachiella faecimaris]SMD36375.1 Tetratricopeptide repeat-containing protein [Reichenbachiella faecimaris]
MMIKNVFLLFCAFSISIYSGAQSLQFEEALSKAHLGRTNRDSALLKANRAFELAQKENSEESINKALTYIGAAYYNRRETDTARFILNKARPSLKKGSFEHGMATWYSGKVCLRSAKYDSAKQYYLQAKEIFAQLDSVLFVSNCLAEIGLTQGMQGNYSEALKWFTQSYENKLKNGLEAETDDDLHNIATVYMRQGSYDKAIEFFRKSIELKDGEGDYSPYIGIGGAFNLQGIPDSALFYYKKAYGMASAEKALGGVVSAAINISNIYFQKKEHRSAIDYLQIASATGAVSARSVPSVYGEMGKNYFGLKMLDSAKYFLMLGLEESFVVNNRQYKAETSEFLSMILAEQEKFEEAYDYAMMSMTYADSINRERRDDAITDQRVKLETLKKQHEIDALHAENQIHQYKQLLLIIGGVSLTLIGVLAFFNLRSRTNLKQAKLEEEKAVLQLELEKRQAQLSAHTLHMIHHKNGLEEIEQHLVELDGVGKQKIKNVISINKAQEKDWDNFNNYFSDVHAQFFDILKSHHQDLTQSEIRLCALVRMNLANNEIATLLNIEPKSVKMARYRLKKKLTLEEEQDLNSYIQKLELAGSRMRQG